MHSSEGARKLMSHLAVNLPLYRELDNNSSMYDCLLFCTDGPMCTCTLDAVILDSRVYIIWPFVTDGVITFLQLKMQPSQNESLSCEPKNTKAAFGEGNWSHPAVLMLIETFREHKSQFSNPKVKKKSIWDKISNRMREKGYNVAASLCDRKWRNLRHSYKFYVNNKRLSGRGKKIWRYYGLLHEIYGQDISATSDLHVGRSTNSSGPSYICSSNIMISTEDASTSSNGSPLIIGDKDSGQDDECVAPVRDIVSPLAGSKKRLSPNDEAPLWFTQGIQDLRQDNEVMITCIENSIEKLLDSQNRRTELLQELVTYLKNK